jgi:hypothetical protein
VLNRPAHISQLNILKKICNFIEGNAFIFLKILSVMKTKTETKEKDFDTVKTFRAIKEKISKVIADMDANQIKDYLKNKKVRLQN